MWPFFSFTRSFVNWRRNEKGWEEKDSNGTSKFYHHFRSGRKKIRKNKRRRGSITENYRDRSTRTNWKKSYNEIDGVTITSIKGIPTRATWGSFFRPISQGRERKGNGKLRGLNEKHVSSFLFYQRYRPSTFCYDFLRDRTCKYLRAIRDYSKKNRENWKNFGKRSPREHRSSVRVVQAPPISFGIVRKYRIIVTSKFWRLSPWWIFNVYLKSIFDKKEK